MADKYSALRVKIENDSIMFYENKQLAHKLIINLKSRTINYFQLEIDNELYQLVNHSAFKYKFMLYKNGARLMELSEIKFFSFKNDFIFKFNNYESVISFKNKPFFFETNFLKFDSKDNLLSFKENNKLESVFLASVFILVNDVCSKWGD